MLQQEYAKPANDDPPPSGLTANGGCVGGPYAAWMDALGVETPAAVRDVLAERGITLLVDTAGRAEECDYERPEGQDAYLTVREEEARDLLNQIEKP